MNPPNNPSLYFDPAILTSQGIKPIVLPAEPEKMVPVPVPAKPILEPAKSTEDVSSENQKKYRTCLGCDTQIEILPRRKPQFWCSGRCAIAANRRLKKTKAECLQCLKVFTPPKEGVQFCSEQCKKDYIYVHTPLVRHDGSPQPDLL